MQLPLLCSRTVFHGSIFGADYAGPAGALVCVRRPAPQHGVTVCEGRLEAKQNRLLVTGLGKPMGTVDQEHEEQRQEAQVCAFMHLGLGGSLGGGSS